MCTLNLTWAILHKCLNGLKGFSCVGFYRLKVGLEDNQLKVSTEVLEAYKTKIMR